MASFKEAPIPPYAVAVSYDGCTNWDVSLPQAQGTKEQCLDFVSKHLPPKGCEFDIIDVDSGRSVSYVFTPAARRYRLQWQDLKSR